MLHMAPASDVDYNSERLPGVLLAIYVDRQVGVAVRSLLCFSQQSGMRLTSSRSFGSDGTLQAGDGTLQTTDPDIRGRRRKPTSVTLNTLVSNYTRSKWGTSVEIVVS